LAKALFDLKDSNTSLISVERLAVPYSEHIIEHLKNFDNQGFNYVIDAFRNVHNSAQQGSAIF
jgi:hypothetical protein